MVKKKNSNKFLINFFFSVLTGGFMWKCYYNGTLDPLNRGSFTKKKRKF
jgi:hypothetical protein